MGAQKWHIVGVYNMASSVECEIPSEIPVGYVKFWKKFSQEDGHLLKKV